MVQVAAARLGLRLRSLRIDGPPEQVLRVLLGHNDETWLYSEDDGVLADEGTLVLLTHVEGASPRLLGLLEHLVRQTRGLDVDPHGVAVVLALRSDAADAAYTVSDRVFAMTTTVSLPRECAAIDLAEVANSIAEELGYGAPFTPESMRAVVLPEIGLRALRKWITQAHIERGLVGPESLIGQITESVATLAERITYCDNAVTGEQYRRWAAQFDDEMRAVADTLLRSMINRGYVMSGRDWHDILVDLVDRSDIPRGHPAVMCKWQPFYKSSPYITWDLKERGNWGGRGSVELDINSDPADWLAAIGTRRRFAIVADDFAGSGTTISKATERLSLLLETCENLHVRVLLVAGFIRGIQKLSNLETRYGDRFRVIVGRTLQDEETCFHEHSVILPDERDRDRLADFCEKFGRVTGFRWPRGFDDMGALFVLPRSVPNTTLPLIWYDDKPGTWHPLLPASAASGGSR